MSEYATVFAGGKTTELAAGTLVTAALSQLGVQVEAVSLVLNGAFIRPQMAALKVLRAGDRLEIREDAAIPQRNLDIFPIQATTSPDEVLVVIGKWAESAGHKLTPDERQLRGLAKGLIKNSGKYGAPLCPCMPKEITGDPVKDEPIACPCVYVENDIHVQGACKCKLFVSPEYHDEMARTLKGMSEL